MLTLNVLTTKYKDSAFYDTIIVFDLNVFNIYYIYCVNIGYI